MKQNSYYEDTIIDDRLLLHIARAISNQNNQNFYFIFCFPGIVSNILMIYLNGTRPAYHEQFIFFLENRNWAIQFYFIKSLRIQFLDINL